MTRSVVQSHSVAETIETGKKLAQQFRGGDVIALHGDLGAGKTCLVKGIALGLGVTHDITSPTFTLINEYPTGRLPLFHIDLYRLDTPQDAINIGIEDYLNTTGVTVIEWAEKIPSLLPATTRHIRLTLVDETTRQIEL
jgi:tRNA threonylcarbamoyladenosine biosynthesis protein TsaE